jgi:stage III sporulation protein AB
MMKLVGALLVVAAGALIGRLQAWKLAQRPAQIRRFVRMLSQLETEISYGYTPLPAALDRIGRSAGERDPLAAMLQSVARRLGQEQLTVMEAWREEAAAYWDRLAFRNAEQEVIAGIGDTLGTTDREHQIKHLRLAAKQLESLELEAVEQQRKYEKMWKSLGLLGGLRVAVIL